MQHKRQLGKLIYPSAITERGDGSRRQVLRALIGCLGVGIAPHAFARRQPIMDMSQLNAKPPQIAPEMRGVLPWKLLTDVKHQRVVQHAGTAQEKVIIVADFPEAVKRLHETRVRMNGYMIPLETKHGQQRFLLSAYPQGCAFCTPDTAQQFADIAANEPIHTTDKLLVLEGKLQILDYRDESGLFYRLRDAKVVG